MAAKRPAIDWKWVKKELLRTERIAPTGTLSGVATACLAAARCLTRPNVVSVKKKVVSAERGGIRLAGGAKLRGRQLSSYLAGATDLHLFVVTIGAALEAEATALMKKGESLEGYLLDRAGSFAVESLAEGVEEALRGLYRKKRASVSRRLSPGYCDWPIEEQFTLKRLIGFSKAGVALTESCMMVPKKSISAIVGIGPVGLFSGSGSRCGMCDKKNCGYRSAS